jgi:endonuclease YncB( thermonuclease family)
MKMIKALYLVLVSISLSMAQNVEKPKPSPAPTIQFFTVDDGCGDPATFSQTWDWREGVVERIVDANTFVFKQETLNGNKETRTLVVELVGIDANVNTKALKEYLAKFENKLVTVWGNLKNSNDASMPAVIAVGRGAIEINELLVEKGIAKFKPFDLGHLIPYNESCQLEKAEGRAKSAKLGIWANKQ